jgi:hypothetical protein
LQGKGAGIGSGVTEKDFLLVHAGSIHKKIMKYFLVSQENTCYRLLLFSDAVWECLGRCITSSPCMGRAGYTH